MDKVVNTIVNMYLLAKWWSKFYYIGVIKKSATTLAIVVSDILAKLSELLSMISCLS